MKNSNTNQNLSNALNNPKPITFTPPPPPINFLPISGPGGRGVGVTTPSSGTTLGVTFPGSGTQSLSYPSIQATNSTQLNSSGSLHMNTGMSQPAYAGSGGPKVYGGFSFKF